VVITLEVISLHLTDKDNSRIRKISSHLPFRPDPKMKKSKKFSFSTKNYLESEKSFNKFSLVLFERENFQNLKVMKVKKFSTKLSESEKFYKT